MDTLQSGTDVFFVLMGAIMVLAMHGGFAFLEMDLLWRYSTVLCDFLCIWRVVQVLESGHEVGV